MQIVTLQIANKMNHVPQPQEEKLGYYFQFETCLGALEPHVCSKFFLSQLTRSYWFSNIVHKLVYFLNSQIVFSYL